MSPARPAPRALAPTAPGLDDAPLPSRAEQVLTRLRAAIQSGDLPAGQRLGLDDLARRFGVSRMPVRDALKALEAEGLVRIIPYRGIEVTRLSPGDIEEIFALREALEQRALRRAVPRLAPADIAALSEILREMDALPEGDARWTVLNGQFHGRINHATGWPRLCEMIETLRANTDRYVRAYVSAGGRARSQAQHRALLEACAAGEVEVACAVIAAHLSDTAAALMRGLEEAGGGEG